MSQEDIDISKEVIKVFHFHQMLTDLTKDVCDFVTLHAPNDDISGPNFMVTCGGEWSEYEATFHYGNTMEEALETALEHKLAEVSK